MRNFAISAGTSATLSFQLVLADGSGLPGSALDRARLSIRARNDRSGKFSDGAIIVSNRNVLNAGNVTIDESGLVSWAITPETLRITGNRDTQTLRATFQFAWDDGASGCVHNTMFTVVC